ncbi:MAG TPA: hypothetical protein VEG39_18865 [Clostridia bacterium]|nr:hypothetical protein [Clostridia bacterium]
MNIKLIKEKKGSAFLYVVLVVFFVVLMGGMAINLLTYEIRVNKITEKRIEAKYLAEAGIEHAMLGDSTAGSETIRDEEGNILYEYSYSVSGSTIDITCYGYLENEKKIKIECSVEDDIIIEWNETQMN